VISFANLGDWPGDVFNPQRYMFPFFDIRRRGFDADANHAIDAAVRRYLIALLQRRVVLISKQGIVLEHLPDVGGGERRPGDGLAVWQFDIGFDAAHHHGAIRIVVEVEIKHQHGHGVVERLYTDFSDTACGSEMVAFRIGETDPHEDRDYENGCAECDAEGFAHR